MAFNARDFSKLIFKTKAEIVSPQLGFPGLPFRQTETEDDEEEKRRRQIVSPFIQPEKPRPRRPIGETFRRVGEAVDIISRRLPTAMASIPLAPINALVAARHAKKTNPNLSFKEALKIGWQEAKEAPRKIVSTTPEKVAEEKLGVEGTLPLLAISLITDPTLFLPAPGKGTGKIFQKLAENVPGFTRTLKGAAATGKHLFVEEPTKYALWGRKVPTTVMQETKSRLMTELELAEPGKRLFIGQPGETAERVIGQRSTFPGWVPEDLRTSKIVAATLDALRRGVRPDKRFKKANELYDVVEAEIMSRTGGDRFLFVPENIIEELGARAPTPFEMSIAFGDIPNPFLKGKLFLSPEESTQMMRRIELSPTPLSPMEILRLTQRTLPAPQITGLLPRGAVHPKKAIQIFKKTGEAVEFIQPGKPGKEVIKLPDTGEALRVATKTTPSGNVVIIGKGGIVIPENLFDDIGGWDSPKTWLGQTFQRIGLFFKDIDRITEKITGKDYSKIRRFLLEPREDAVTDMVTEHSVLLKQAKTYVVDTLGIKGEKLRAAVMQWGEKRLTEKQLYEQFSPIEANNIKAADEWFRIQYDNLLVRVNEVNRRFGKPEIPRRENYYTHFQELSERWDQIFTAEKGIDPWITLTQPFRKGEMKFNPAALQRKGGPFKDDAIGAFERYLRPTLHNIHMTESIIRQQKFVEALAAQTVKKPTLNQFIDALKANADILRGRSDPLTRYIMDKFTGRRLMHWLYKASRRFGHNAIIGNASAAFMQTAGFANSIPVNGTYRTIKGITNQIYAKLNGLDDLEKISPFMRRRYIDLTSIDPDILQRAEAAGALFFRMIEYNTTAGIWRATYDTVLSKGLKGTAAIREADRVTMRLVAGRSLGELPEAFSTPLGAIGLQFQVEVNNIVQLGIQDISLKKPTQLFKYMGALYVFNNGYEMIMGRRPLIDPIEAGIDVAEILQDEELTSKGKAVLASGRVAGEILSGTAGGQTVAGFIPERVGGVFGGISKADLLGRTEAGIFPSGIPISTGLRRIATADSPAEAALEAVSQFGTPFGGSQIRKTTVAGLEFAKGNIPINELPQALVFGKYSTRSRQEELKRQDRLSRRLVTTKFHKADVEKRAVRLFDSLSDLTRQEQDRLLLKMAQRGQLDEETFDAFKRLSEEDAAGLTGYEKRFKSISNTDKAKVLYDEIGHLPRQEQDRLLLEMAEKGLLSEDAFKKYIQLVKEKGD